MPAQTRSSVRRARAAAVAAVLVVVGSVLAAPAAALHQIGSLGGVQPMVPGRSPLSAEATDELIVRYRGGLPPRMERTVAHRVAGTVLVNPIPSLDTDIVRLNASTPPAQAIASYRRNPLVRHVEMSVQRELGVIPDDTDFVDQWGIHNTGQTGGTSDADIDGDAAWDEETGVAETVIAIVDTGAQLTHPDLANRLWINAGEIPGNDVDDDDNGYVDDVNGYDFQNDDGDPTNNSATCETSGCPAHGTHVAGTVAAQMDNAIGVAGVCPGCRIMILRSALGTAELIEAYRYAADNGAAIVNGSYGGAIWSGAERNVIQQEAGLLFAFAAGNAALDNDQAACRTGQGCSPSYPSSYGLNHILAVASSDDDDFYSTFTHWGRDSVDVAAPGTSIMSTWPGSTYSSISGTSMAAPHVAGLAGLVKSANPSYTAVNIKNAIKNSVDTPAALDLYASLGLPTPIDGDFTATQGRVNADAALGAPTTAVTITTDGTPGSAKLLKTKKESSLTFPEDGNDYYKKKLTKGVKYKVTLTVPNGRDFDLYLWAPGVKDTFSWDAGCFEFGGPCALRRASTSKTVGKDEAFAFKAGKGGTYYVHVSNFFSTGNYTVKIVKV